MKRFFVALALVLSPVPALADDASYCAQLADLALTYLGKYSRGESIPDLDVASSIEQCQHGNFDKGIPTLESKLRASGFTLPRH
jgi:hypothetical protein